MVYKTEQSLEDFNAWGGGYETWAVLFDRRVCDKVEQYISECLQDPTATDINDFLWFERDAIAQYLGYEDWDTFVDREFYTDINGVRIDISDEVHWHDEAGYDEHGDMIDFTIVDEDGDGYFNLAYEGEENPERWAYYTEIEII